MNVLVFKNNCQHYMRCKHAPHQINVSLIIYCKTADKSSAISKQNCATDHKSSDWNTTQGNLTGTVSQDRKELQTAKLWTCCMSLSFSGFKYHQILSEFHHKRIFVIFSSDDGTSFRECWFCFVDWMQEVLSNSHFNCESKPKWKGHPTCISSWKPSGR